MLRWRQTVSFASLLEYYKGLIRLRKKLPGLWDKSSEAAGRILEKHVIGSGVVAFRIDNRLRRGQQAQIGGGTPEAENTRWKELFVVYNASGDVVKVGLPQGGWVILADAQQADCSKEAVTGRVGQLCIPACSGMVLGCPY